MAASYKCTLSAETLEKAKKELNEDPSTRHIEVKNLAQRLEKVPGLKPRTDFEFLLKFLRARKFDQQRTFDLLLNYYQVRVDQKDMFEDLIPSHVRHMVEAGVVEALNGRDNNGCAVVVMRIGKWDPERYPILDLSRTMYLVLGYLLEDEETQVNGVHIINNMEGMTMKHATGVNPSFAKRVTGMIQNVAPMRFKRMDYVNEPTFFDLVFAIVKQFLKQKMIQRLYLNGTKFENLQTMISADVLTTDLGGKAEPGSNKAWLESFLGSDSYFIDDNKYGYVNMGLEKEKKSGKAENADMAGLGGTFKKLDI